MSGLLAGKTALVTGSSRGIGLGIAEAFAAEGASLHLIADDPAVLHVAARLGAHGLVCDISRADAVERALGEIPRLDILVNNAGLERLTPLDDASPENAAMFARIIEINILGTFLVTRAALPKLSAGGRIINTASVWARGAEAAFSAYVASKHAVIGLTKTWAKELGPRGIAVNAVCPGWVRTEASLRSLSIMAQRAATSEEALLASITAVQALPGLMEPADIVGVYVFLASDLSSNVTGQSLGADRGEFPW